MAINIKEAYPANADSPSLDYTTGSFRNDSTPESEDGTPLEKGWANDFLGARDAILKQANITPSGDVETAEASDVLDALNIIAKQNASVQNMVVFDVSGVTNWTVPQELTDGLIKADVFVVGGGGGGGKGATGRRGGGGGGAGVGHGLVDLTGLTSITMTVGVGGVGASANGSSGSSGGTSSFGTIISCTGGGGGIGISGSEAGGSCGVSTGAQVNDRYGYGHDGGGTTLALGHGGGPGAGRSGTSSGIDAVGYGSGGGGSIGGGDPAGDGVNGLIVIRW